MNPMPQLEPMLKLSTDKLFPRMSTRSGNNENVMRHYIFIVKKSKAVIRKINSITAKFYKSHVSNG